MKIFLIFVLFMNGVDSINLESNKKIASEGCGPALISASHEHTTRWGFDFMELKIESKKFGVQTVLIDDEDYQKVKLFKWRIHEGRYTLYVVAFLKKFKRRQSDARNIKIGHVILDVGTRTVIDHANCDGLDNRKVNLRIASNSQNGANRTKRKPTISIFKGVTYKRKEGFWACRLRKNDKIIYGGGFQSELHAAQRYNELAIKHFGEFARLNEFSPAELDELKKPNVKRKSLFKRNLTGYVGVSIKAPHKRGKPFISTIYHNGKNISLGVFDTAKEAAIAYNNASLKFRGEYGFQNKIS